MKVSACYFFSILCMVAYSSLYAQETADSAAGAKKLQWKAYIDAYYSYDFSRPANHRKASFLYNHKRHNEFSVNLAYAGVGYADGLVRANLSLMAGDYPEYNLPSEPALFRSLFEANVGVSISKKRTIWMDAGILPSHIGFETAINPDNWTLSRSIMAENSPYYETGIRLSYQSLNKNWYMAALLLNGWQRMRRVDGNNSPAFGTQLTFSPASTVSFNWSTFIGNDKPDSLRRWRYFNNFFATWKPTEKIYLMMGFDYGLEQKERNSSKLNSWYSPVFMMRYHFNKWAVAGRAEFYKDKEGVIVALQDGKPFEMQSYSLNVDREIGNKIVWRMEGRLFKNSSAYFVREGELLRANQQVTSSLSVRF